MTQEFAKMTVEKIARYLSEAAPTVEELGSLSGDRRSGVRKLVERYHNRRENERRERERLAAMSTFENQARVQGYTYIAGVDEVGRGPLAGPVMAAAVILPEDFYLPGVNDSKKLSPARREELYSEITARALAWSVGVGEVAEIDTVNILVASKVAMQRALTSLSLKPDYVLIDAIELDDLPIPQQGIISGDSKSLSIAAASIIAKVTRDRWMCEMDKVFPGYGFADHKGYPTNEHRQAISRLGICPLHRKSFMLLREEHHV
ncbi:MAG: ribonuclease HII [Bacillota bacterium]|nr:ribonuclease HII [Bacillota bacterium]MDW7684436.1 ribonuclease HII [Bacillota bacterium]